MTAHILQRAPSLLPAPTFSHVSFGTAPPTDNRGNGDLRYWFKGAPGMFISPSHLLIDSTALSTGAHRARALRDPKRRPLGWASLNPETKTFARLLKCVFLSFFLSHIPPCLYALFHLLYILHRASSFNYSHQSRLTLTILMYNASFILYLHLFLIYSYHGVHFSLNF